MSRTREYRIHQEQRKKHEARKRALDRGYAATDKQVGIMATTPTPCSNECCGNCRKHSGQTIQERKHSIDPQEAVIQQDDE